VRFTASSCSMPIKKLEWKLFGSVPYIKQLQRYPTTTEYYRACSTL